MKDDTLGLGAKRKRDPLEEPTGLDAFKGLLGRLNGKPDAELEVEQRRRHDSRLAQYVTTRWQAVRFIRGGVLSQNDEDTTADRETSGGSRAGAEKRRKKMNPSDISAAPECQDTSHEPDSIPDRCNGKWKEKAKKQKQGREPKKDRKKDRRKNSDDDAQGAGMRKSEANNGKSSSKGIVKANERRPAGRHMFRYRNIEEKKKSLLDDKLVNEVSPSKRL